MYKIFFLLLKNSSTQKITNEKTKRNAYRVTGERERMESLPRARETSNRTKANNSNLISQQSRAHVCISRSNSRPSEPASHVTHISFSLSFSLIRITSAAVGRCVATVSV